VKLNYILVLIVVAIVGVWSYSSLSNWRTNRKDTLIKMQQEERKRVSLQEEKMYWNWYFFEYPFGAGVGKRWEIRKKQTGIFVLSHDEITRMLAEHGSLGTLGLIILFVTLVLYLENKFNMYLLCFCCFFWFLTINLLCDGNSCLRLFFITIKCTVKY
jgi:hypothetical protein